MATQAKSYGGLFGPSPEELEQSQRQQFDTAAMNYGRMTPQERIDSTMYRAGGMLTGAALEGLGYENTAQAKAKKIQGVVGQIDTETSAGLLEAARKFNELGLSNEAQIAFQKANDLKRQEAAAAAQKAKDELAVRKQDTLDAAQLATSGLQAAQAQKALRENPNLTPVEVGVKGKPGWMQKILFDKTGKEESIPIGEPYQTAQAMKISVGGSGGGESKQPITYVDDKGNAVWGTIAEARGKAAAVYDPNTRALVSGAQTGGKSGMEMSVKDYGSAQAAKNTIPKVRALIAQIEKGDVTTGAMADMRLGFAKLASVLGGEDAAKNATDTEIAEAMMGSEVFPLIQSLGIGAKGMDTPAERDFMRGVLTGKINLEKGTILNMAKRRDAEMSGVIQRWDASVDNGTRDQFFRSTGIPKARLSDPKTTTPPANSGWGTAKKVSK